MYAKSLLLVACGVVLNVQVSLSQELPTAPIVCAYPRLEERLPFQSLDPTRLALTTDTEPNDSVTNAQAIPLGYGTGKEQDVDITGSIKRSPAGSWDQDWFSFDASAGDTVGVAVLAVDGNNLDSLVAIRGANGAVLLQNDQHGGIANFYPPESPFPAGGTQRDSALTFAIPSTGRYYVQVNGHGAAEGGYLAQVRLRKPPLSQTTTGTTQILFLDFNGATGIHADNLFGSGGIHNTTLSGLDSYITRWGLAAARRDDLIDKIVQNVTNHFAQLLVGTASRIEIRNSKDHTDPFGQPNVSRVIVGGSIAQLGISTIGIAEFVDPANYSTDDTAVVLLDLLSESPFNANSVLSIPRASTMSVEDAVAHVVACVVTHEACHFLGCWHTSNTNNTTSLPDSGGSLSNTAGVGPDGVLGTADDVSPIIADDNYASEQVGRITDIENVRAQVLASLSVGAITANEEGENLRAFIAGLDRWRELPLNISLSPTYTALDTRKLLGLPADTGIDIQPLSEIKAQRFQAIQNKFKTRLDAVENRGYSEVISVPAGAAHGVRTAAEADKLKELLEQIEKRVDALEKKGKEKEAKQ